MKGVILEEGAVCKSLRPSSLSRSVETLLSLDPAFISGRLSTWKTKGSIPGGPGEGVAGEEADVAELEASDATDASADARSLEIKPSMLLST